MLKESNLIATFEVYGRPQKILFVNKQSAELYMSNEFENVAYQLTDSNDKSTEKE